MNLFSVPPGFAPLSHLQVYFDRETFFVKAPEIAYLLHSYHRYLKLHDDWQQYAVQTLILELAQGCGGHERLQFEPRKRLGRH